MNAELDSVVSDNRVALRFVGARARFDDEKCARAGGCERTQYNSFPPQDPEPQKSLLSLYGPLGFHPSSAKP
jgi:hypothetical protein